MDVTLAQALLIGILMAICFAGQLWGIFTNRAIFLSFVIGVVLGDVQTALAFGAIAELAFMGFGVGAGGTSPPNPLGPGVVGTLMAILLKDSGMTVETALALSFPFAVIIQVAITIIYSISSGTLEWTKRAINEGKYRKFTFLSHITFYQFLILGFAVGFTSSYYMHYVQKFVEAFPQWLIDGLTVSGGILPAIGFAMILSVMVKKEYIAYLFLGYISISYLELPVIGLAFVGAFFALLDFFRNKDNNGNGGSSNGEEVIEDGI